MSLQIIIRMPKNECYIMLWYFSKSKEICVLKNLTYVFLLHISFPTDPKFEKN